MRHLDFHIAGALMTLLGVLCLLPAVAVVMAVGSVAALPAGAFATVATFQALRVPFGRTAARVLDR